MSSSPWASLWDEIEDLGRSSGLAALGVCDAGLIEPARSLLPTRKSEGLNGSMQFTYRNPDRSTDPTRSLEGARSIIVGALGYGRKPVPPPQRASARVASYAWRDHYADLRACLEPIAELLEARGSRARIHLDDNNLVDRNVAFRAGIGWFGKNANLLLPGRGSWFVLGSIVTDAVLAPTGPPQVDGCGPCTRCIDECPTAAIVAPGVVDARRCLAWIVQGPGEIPVEFRKDVGDRLYGCDDCQDVCPPNIRMLPSASEAEPDAQPWIDIEWILSADDETLMNELGRWYIADRDPNILRRTALVVLGNIGDPSDPSVSRLLDHHLASSSPLVREHARWAAAELGLSPTVAS